jgi:leucyl aminopeptidase (aminopeptidase T)
MASLKLKRAVNSLIKDYIGLEEDETILIVSDEKRQEFGISFFESAKKLCEDAFYLEVKSKYNSENILLPDVILDSIKAVDTAIIVTEFPFYNSEALKNIASLGIRVAIIPIISEDSFCRCLGADYDKIAELSQKFYDLFNKTSIIRLESKNGTDLSLPIKSREIFQAAGIIRNIGETSVLPAGKVLVSPWDEKSNGIVVIDTAVDGIGILENPITIEIVDGLATKITGDGEEAKHLAKILNKVGEQARILAEFGVGTNFKATVCNDFYETESTLGNAYIAFGGNSGLGGTNENSFRLSCVINKPNVYIDDELLLAHGKLMME